MALKVRCSRAFTRELTQQCMGKNVMMKGLRGH